MEFASKYGYNYGHQGSDSEEVSDEETETKQKVKRKIRKADSNVISVKFDQLVLPNEMFAGEPLKCKKCGAIMSSLSKAHVKTDSENASAKTWECEFCYEKNDVSRLLSAGMDEVPKEADVTFLIEQAPVKQDTHVKEEASAKGPVSEDDNYLTFCIDVSGSMDTLCKNSDGSGSISRLNAVKAACFETLGNLKETEPKKRTLLITFSDEVKFYRRKSPNNAEPVKEKVADEPTEKPLEQASNSRGLLNRLRNSLRLGGSKPASFSNFSLPNSTPITDADYITVPKSLNNDKNKMFSYASQMEISIEHLYLEYDLLKKWIQNLRTEGSTALGPALVFSIGFSSRRSGSQIILCTDGCANEGMGSVERGDTKVAEKFYEDLADQAKSNGVTVNVISMEGTDCKLALLGKVADRSNGTLSIVNPAKLGEQFKSILENRIVATSVKAKLIVNSKYLYIRDEELEAAEGKAIEKNDMAAKEALEATKKSMIEKDIGNANIDTEITFEYGVRKLKDAEGKSKEATLSELFKELPFQLQITYTTLDGAKAMRVYTKIQEFTKDRKQAERSVHSESLLFANAAQKMSYHVASNHAFMAKFKGQQMQQQMLCNAWAAPSGYTSTERVVRKISKSSRMEELSDDFAEEIYSGKKMSRNKISKDKQ